VRNTRVIDIYNELINFDIRVDIYDPWIESEEVKQEYNIDVINKLTFANYAAVILAVAHKEFLELDVRALAPNGVIYDVKGVLPKKIIDSRL
jgi:UDP-N-acetyl-D-galactosamine dehydrogenase